ncbi:MAG: hypothetical protein CO096_13870, partial [Armatimonadetes bacterium CG_4_9_14_3_um_filter_66_14]
MKPFAIWSGVLPHKTVLRTVGLLPALYIPPPFLPALLPLKVTFASVCLTDKSLVQYIPPPEELAELPLK